MRSEGAGFERTLVGLLFLVLLAGGVAWVWKEDSAPAAKTGSLPSEPEQELLLLRAENRMLKAMLGQVDGKVLLLGPTSSGRKGYAKVVWDESLQSGYFYATQLPAQSPSEVYQLSLGAPGQPLAKCCTFVPDKDGRVRQAFSSAVRLFGASEFVVTLEKGSGASPPRGERILEAKGK